MSGHGLRVLAFLLVSTSLTAAVHAEKKPQPLPFLGIGPAMGWELGDIDGLSISGPAMELRFAALFKTYPIVAVALDAKFSRLHLDVNGTDQTVDRITAGPTIGLMIPFDIFGIELEGAPRGAGLPVFVGLVGLDRVVLASDGGSFRGLGLKAGVQLPLGKLVLQLEYARTRFGDLGGASFGSGESANANTFAAKLQIPVVFVNHD